MFGLLEKLSTTIYYPLEDDTTIDGFSIQRSINGEDKTFIFLNTASTTEKQIFTAAHELGHIYKVAQKVTGKKNVEKSSEEEIVNRFAAELLMPKDLFYNKVEEELKLLDYNGTSISWLNLFRLIVYLMNDFFVPYKAVVKRLNEIGRITDNFKEQLINEEKKHADTIKAIIDEGQYTRLHKISKIKRIDNLSEILKTAEEKCLVSENFIIKMKIKFDIPIQDHCDETESLLAEQIPEGFIDE